MSATDVSYFKYEIIRDRNDSFQAIRRCGSTKRHYQAELMSMAVFTPRLTEVNARVSMPARSCSCESTHQGMAKEGRTVTYLKVTDTNRG